jgi:hypothetical protein
MRSHPYLRAYMAGILLPTWFLLLILGGLAATRAAHPLTAGVERAIVFPMAVVPNLWGVWNLLYVALRLRGRISLGAFGALLPIVIVPAGVGLASLLDLGFYTARQGVLVLPVGMAIYYLAWKYAVALFNRAVEIG